MVSISNSAALDFPFNSPACLMTENTTSALKNFMIEDNLISDPHKRINTGIHSSTFPNLGMPLEPLRISKEKFRINLTNEEAEAVELTKAFALCHQAILKSQDSHDIKF